MSGNLLVIASEDFSSIRTVAIGPHEPEWGFSDVKILPDTLQLPQSDGPDKPPVLLMGVKVKELKGVTESKVAIFDTMGNFYTDPPFQPLSEDPNHKYEGLSFLPAAIL